LAKLFNLFGDSKATVGATALATPVPAAPPAAIPLPSQRAPDPINYDASLVTKLTEDHARLVNTFTQLMPLLKQGSLQGFRTKLANFKTEFQGHIIKENVKFYVYLEQSLLRDETNMELMRDFRREMNTISRAVVNFCNKYIESNLDFAAIKQFEAESGQIAQALLHRIEREERDLYSLYR